MPRLIIVGLTVAAMALPAVMTPTAADAASCRERKATGTVLGGLGGALLGNAVSKGGGGLIIGGVGGALVGREIGKSGCRTRTAYYAPAPRPAARSVEPRPVRQVYYDARGNPVAADGGTYQTVSTSPPGGACRNATISYYDDRGRLDHRDVQICPR